MSDFISELSSEIRKERINAPVTFADDVLKRIEAERSGGFSSMPASSRILLITLVLIVYSSFGILLGMQGFRNLGEKTPARSDDALVELMNTHHLNTEEMQDQLFSHFNFAR
jgi:hypothetical protein